MVTGNAEIDSSNLSSVSLATEIDKKVKKVLLKEKVTLHDL